MATLTSTKIKNTYDALLKSTDNDAIGSSAKQITDGLGNGTPLYISTTQIGIGVTPEATYDLHVYSNAKVGGNLTVTGDLTVEGTTTTIDTQTLTVEDPLIEVASNNTSTDAVDIGWYGKYAPSGTTLYAGLFRDTGDSKFKLFRNLEEQPTTTVNTSGTGYTRAGLVIGGLEATTGDFTDTVTVDGDIEVENASGFGRIEIGGSSGAYIDLKSPFSDDFDLRLYTAGTNAQINALNGELDITANTNINLQYQGTDVLVMSSTGVAVTGTGSFTGQVTIPETPVANTDAASKGYVDSQVTAQDLDFAGDSGTGSVDLDSQSLSITGGTLITTTALNQNLDIDHDSVSRTDTTSSASPSFGGTFTAVDSVTSSTEGHITAINLKTVTVPTPTYPAVNNNTITINAGSNLDTGGAFTLNQSFDEIITIDLATTITGLTSVSSTTFSGQLDGTISSTTTATTQTQGDNSTKVATTAYVDSAITAEDLDFAGDSGTGSVDLDSQTFTIAGGTNVTTSASGQTITINATGSIDGSGTANYVAKWSDTDTITNSIIYDNGTNVGIGTDSPNFKLGLSNSNTLTAVYQQFTNGTTGTTSSDGTVMGIDSDGDFLINNQEAKEIKLYTSDTQRLTIQSGGNVGIGTTSPSRSLDVAGKGRFTINGDALEINSSDSNGAYATWENNGTPIGYIGSGYHLWSSPNNVNTSFGIRAQTRLDLGIQASPHLTILNTGNVGIGTSSPDVKLEINGGADAIAKITGTTTAARFDYKTNSHHRFWQILESDGRFRFYDQTNGSERFTIDSSGNVGIGVSPYSFSQLHIYDTSDVFLTLQKGTANGYIINDGTNISLASDQGTTGKKLLVNRSAPDSSLVIDSSGDVAINEFLRVGGNVNNANTFTYTLQSRGLLVAGDSGTSESNLYLHRDDVTISAGNVIGNLHFSGQDGASNIGAQIKAEAAASWSATSAPSNIIFSNCTSGSNTLTERMRIDSSGNIGIGTTSLTNSSGYNTLSISGTTGAQIAFQTSGVGKHYIYSTATDFDIYNGQAGNLKLYTNSTERMRITSGGTVKIGDGTYAAQIHFPTPTYNNYIGYDGSLDGLQIATNGEIKFQAGSGYAERMRIDSSGNVGIGTDSPSNKLEVFAPENGDGIVIQSDSAGFNRAPALHLNPIAASANARNWAISAFRDVSQSLSFSSSNAKGGDAYAVATTRMIIDGISGNVGIGTTSPTYKFHVASSNNVSIFEDTSGSSGATFCLFNAPSVFAMGSITRNGSATSVLYNTSSDYRLKEDLQDFNALDLVDKITAYDYKWKDTEQRDYGFVAHELQEVMPNVVTGEKDGERMQSVDYSKLTPVLLKAIQELKAEIETLKAQINN